MSPIFSALIPIAGLITLGWGLRKSALVHGDLWGGINKLSYVGLLPALLFSTISRADFRGLEAGPFLIAVTVGFIIMGAICLSLKPVLKTDGPTYTSVFQGGLRWNGFVLFALAAPAFGAEGAALAALVFAPTVPLINMMSVAVMTVWGKSGKKPNARRVFMRILTNPLILGCAAGALTNALGWFQTGPVADTAELAGRAALPLILLCIGAGLDFSAVRAKPLLLSLAVVLKLIISPAVFYGLGRMMGMEGLELALITAVGATPGAAGSYVLAKEMGGDAELTAGHVTVTTILAFIMLPLWISLTGYMG